MQTLGFIIPNVGGLELVVIGIVLLLLFGRRLPEVGRSLGQGIVEFKKGLKDVTDDITKDPSDTGSTSTEPPKFDAAKAPNNPDMLTSAHTTSTQIKEPTPTRETPDQE